MEAFKCIKGIEKINDSMECSSGVELAYYQEDGYAVTLEVHGDVKVDYKGDRYYDAADFPEELLKKFHDGTWGDDPDINAIDNNWFEVFFWEVENGKLRDMGWSDVVDIDFDSEEDARSFLKDTLQQYKSEL